MKRILSLIAVLLLLTACVLPVLAADYETRSGNPLVVDEAGLLTASQRQSLETQAISISEAHSCEVIILTVNTIGGKDVQEFAEDYYVDHNYGYGSDCSGMLLLLNMGEHDLYIATRGKAIDAFTDEAIDFVMDRFLGAYEDTGSWNSAFETYLDYSDRGLGYSDGSLSQEEADELDQEYDEYMGFVTKEESKPNYVRKGIFSVLLGGLGGFVPVSVSKSGMKSVRKKRDASGYRRGDGFRLDVNQDIYLYSNVAVHVIQTQTPKTGSSGGHGFSSGHTSTHTHSSGATFGGHGRKF